MAFACKIECIWRAPDGRPAGFRGIDGEGKPWSLSSAELAQAIERGRMTCYVVLEGQAHLVSVRAAGDSRTLETFLGSLEALPLPDCP